MSWVVIVIHCMQSECSSLHFAFLFEKEILRSLDSLGSMFYGMVSSSSPSVSTSSSLPFITCRLSSWSHSQYFCQNLKASMLPSQVLGEEYGKEVVMQRQVHRPMKLYWRHCVYFGWYTRFMSMTGRTRGVMSVLCLYLCVSSPHTRYEIVLYEILRYFVQEAIVRDDITSRKGGTPSILAILNS